jgi:pimeloyl-ACP methyl ester carboxylesterase
MATFALIHGGGDVGWYWHLVEPVLRQRGHDVVAPDLPCDDDAATLGDYADTVVDAIGDRRNVIVVAQSYGGFTAPIVADRRSVDALVLVAGMVPTPGESPAEWWTNTRYRQAQPVDDERMIQEAIRNQPANGRGRDRAVGIRASHDGRRVVGPGNVAPPAGMRSL